MSTAHRPERTGAQDEEIIDSLVLNPLPGRSPPEPAPLPALPPLRLPTDADPRSLLLDMARLDRSGRVYARALLKALGWPAGHGIDIDVVAGALVVGSSATGRHAVGSRGGIRLPAAARRMCLAEVAKHLEISEATWHRWMAQYGGMKADDAKGLKELERENARLKKIVADQLLDIDMLKELTGETGEPSSGAAVRWCCSNASGHHSDVPADWSGNPARPNGDRPGRRRMLRSCCGSGCGRFRPLIPVGGGVKPTRWPPVRAWWSTVNAPAGCGSPKGSNAPGGWSRNAASAPRRISGCARAGRTRCGRWTSRSTSPSTADKSGS